MPNIIWKIKLFWSITAKYKLVVFVKKRRYFTVFSPGYFEGVVGGGIGVRARRILGTTNLLLFLLYFAFVFTVAPWQKRETRTRKTNKQKQ